MSQRRAVAWVKAPVWYKKGPGDPVEGVYRPSYAVAGRAPTCYSEVTE
jgi:hypothetical protein